MNATCGDCGSVFRVDPGEDPERRVRARCSVCGGVFAVAPGGAARATPALAAPLAAAGEAALPPRAALRANAAPAAPPARPATPVQPTPAVAIPEPAPIWGSPDTVPAVRHGADVEPPPTPASAPRVTSPASSARPLPPAPAAPPPAPSVAPPPTPTAPGVARRPINPYLASDPRGTGAPAARALVSDLIAYHPGKREEGLRDGTLKQLFREEIKKSWRSTSSRSRAGGPSPPRTSRTRLNDILAGGPQDVLGASRRAARAWWLLYLSTCPGDRAVPRGRGAARASFGRPEPGAPLSHSRTDARGHDGRGARTAARATARPGRRAAGVSLTSMASETSWSSTRRA
jgi:hypothetical protein